MVTRCEGSCESGQKSNQHIQRAPKPYPICRRTCMLPNLYPNHSRCARYVLWKVEERCANRRRTQTVPERTQTVPEQTPLALSCALMHGHRRSTLRHLRPNLQLKHLQLINIKSGKEAVCPGCHFRVTNTLDSPFAPQSITLSLFIESCDLEKIT